MSKQMNAKDELLLLESHVGQKAACARIEMRDQVFRLNLNHTEAQRKEFLDSIDSRYTNGYNNGYGSQNLYGTIWFADSTWAERGEYDGSEWWEYKKCPYVPEELKIYNCKENEMSNITLNGIEYTPVTPAPTGTRAVVVVDRGWVFAGDVTRKNGRIQLTNAVWVFRWESVGFEGVIANPKSPKVTIRPMPNGVDIPAAAEIFCVPVPDTWACDV